MVVCYANLGSVRKQAGSSLYISRNIFRKFSNTSASNNTSLWTYKLCYLHEFCVYLRLQSQALYLIPQVWYFLLSCPYLHLIIWIFSPRWLTIFDNDLDIIFALSINFNLCHLFFINVFPFLTIFITSLSIGTKKVKYLSIFSKASKLYFSFFD